MGSLLDLLNAAKVLFAPFLPHTSATLHHLLGFDGSLESNGWSFEPVPAGRQLPAPRPLFRKLEISAEVPSGVPEDVARTVTENAKTLKFDQHGFEEQ